MVSGTLVALYEDMTLPANMLEFSTFALDLLFTGSAISTSGYNYSLEFHIPNAKLAKAPVSLTADTIVINSDFTTIKDPSLGYAIKIIAQNTLSNASLAGAYVAPCTVTAVIPNNTTATAPVNTTAGLVVGQTYNLAGATSAYNPCTVTSITDGTHVVLTGAASQTTIQGNIAVGASLTPASPSATYGPGGLGGWQNS
jgi:hypothetical protein